MNYVTDSRIDMVIEKGETYILEGPDIFEFNTITLKKGAKLEYIGDVLLRVNLLIKE